VESALATIREINSGMSMKAAVGNARVYVLDEVQSFSRAKFAQEASLKMLEDGQDHVYFMLCTTDPKKVILTIRNRCTTIQVKSVSDRDLGTLVRRVTESEKKSVSTAVVDKIVEVATGSPRSALVNLEKVLGLPDEKSQLLAISPIMDSPEAFELVKVLLPWTGSPDWKVVARKLEELKEEDPEGLRLMILSSARAQLLKNGNPLAYKAIRCLDTPFYDRPSGNALLVAGCYQIIHGGK
jgi:DNA polymerase III gamma/tau subunit